MQHAIVCHGVDKDKPVDAEQGGREGEASALGTVADQLAQLGEAAARGEQEEQHEGRPDHAVSELLHGGHVGEPLPEQREQTPAAVGKHRELQPSPAALALVALVALSHVRSVVEVRA